MQYLLAGSAQRFEMAEKMAGHRIACPRTMNALCRTWSLWIVRGVASLLFGLLTIVRPHAAIAAIVFVYGMYALTDGALLLGFGFRHEGRKAPYVVRGLLSIAAGLVAFLLPGLTALSLYVLIGAWAVTAGAAEPAIATVRVRIHNVTLPLHA